MEDIMAVLELPTYEKTGLSEIIFKDSKKVVDAVFQI